MGFLDKVKVKTAVQAGNNKFDLSSKTVTTMQFYKPKPIYTRCLIPGQSLDINLNSFARLAPLAEPMLAGAQMVHNAFYVPYSLVMEGFTDFLSRTPHAYGSGSTSIISNTSRISMSDIITLFTDEDNFSAPVNDRSTWNNHTLTTFYNVSEADSQTTGTIAFKADFRSPVAHTTAGSYFMFTEKGKLYYDILIGLGYQVDFSVLTAGSTQNDKEFSALNLLAYAKIFSDWFVNPAYSNYLAINKYFVGAPVYLRNQELDDILDHCYQVMYRNDYFTSSWDNPVAPNNNLLPSISISDSTVDYNTTGTFNKLGIDTKPINTAGGSSNTVGTPLATTYRDSGSSSSSGSAFSQFMIDALKHVTDYITRYRLVGSRAIDRYEADFGIKLTREVLNRSQKCGEAFTPLQVSEVVQTAPDTLAGSTVETGVGNYTGKGMMYDSNGNFHLDPVQEFGVFIIISYIEPTFMYTQGYDRNICAITRDDFFQGEFDNLGPQAIERGELLSQNDNLCDFSSIVKDAVFGYLPRFAHYKVGRDILSGDFVLDSKNTDLSGWIMQRRFDPTKQSTLKHNKSFTEANGTQFNNIWLYQPNNDLVSFDPFYCLFRFNVTSYAPMKPLFDTYDFHSEGKELIKTINGTRLNG